MRSTLNSGSILSLGLGAIFCLSLFACSSDGDTPSVDAGKRDGSAAGGKGGGGAGGSSARGGSGGSQAGGSGGSGGAPSGGAQAGGAQAGGSQAGGAQAGGSQAGGSGGGTGGAKDGGNTDTSDGGALDVSGSDAEDVALPNDDVPAGDTPGSDDGGVAVVLDGDSVDVSAADVAVALDVEIDSTPLDVTVDVSEDGPADTAPSDVPAGNCLATIIGNGYAVAALACTQCQESAGQHLPLESQCKTMLDCLAAAACTSTTSADNCFLNCQNQVSGGSQTETGACVAALMDAAQCPTP